VDHVQLEIYIINVGLGLFSQCIMFKYCGRKNKCD